MALQPAVLFLLYVAQFLHTGAAIAINAPQFINPCPARHESYDDYTASEKNAFVTLNLAAVPKAHCSRLSNLLTIQTAITQLYRISRVRGGAGEHEPPASLQIIECISCEDSGDVGSQSQTSRAVFFISNGTEFLPSRGLADDLQHIPEQRVLEVLALQDTHTRIEFSPYLDAVEATAQPAAAPSPACNPKNSSSAALQDDEDGEAASGCGDVDHEPAKRSSSSDNEVHKPAPAKPCIAWLKAMAASVTDCYAFGGESCKTPSVEELCAPAASKGKDDSSESIQKTRRAASSMDEYLFPEAPVIAGKQQQQTPNGQLSLPMYIAAPVVIVALIAISLVALVLKQRTQSVSKNGDLQFV